MDHDSPPHQRPLTQAFDTHFPVHDLLGPPTENHWLILHEPDRDDRIPQEQQSILEHLLRVARIKCSPMAH